MTHAKGNHLNAKEEIIEELMNKAYKTYNK